MASFVSEINIKWNTGRWKTQLDLFEKVFNLKRLDIKCRINKSFWYFKWPVPETPRAFILKEKIYPHSSNYETL